MSMPIQRQSESYGYFDEGPRFARDRTSSDLPRGLAGVINSMGPRITGGMLNTRTAVNVDGMDDHAYHTELPSGPGGDWIGDEDGYHAPRREWNPDAGYEPTDEDEHRSELVGEDDTSEYNWGPTPETGAGGYPIDEHGPGEHPDFSDGHALPFDTPIYNPRSSPYDEHTGSRHPFDRTAACQTCGGDVYHISGEGFVHNDDDDNEGWQLDEHHRAEPDEDDDRELGLQSAEAWHSQRELEGSKTAFAPAPPVPGAHAYQAGHRVGLPWRDDVKRGTVIGLNGPKVAIRWDDEGYGGQYSDEEPHNIHLL